MDNLNCTPVPLRRRKDGWSPARQWGFLQALEDTANIAEAARKVGMSEASAHRLRRHPEAEDFRRAWDAAQARIWRRVEQVALDRVVNGDIEIIERDGIEVATRRRPCSDRLMIHMLQEQVRRLAATAAAEADARAAADSAWEKTAKTARIERRTPPARPAEAGDAETAALRAQYALVQALPDATGWDGPGFDPVYPVPGYADLAGDVPVLPMPDRSLAPDDGQLVLATKRVRLTNPAARKVRDLPPGADFPAVADAAPYRHEAAADDDLPGEMRAHCREPRIIADERRAAGDEVQQDEGFYPGGSGGAARQQCQAAENFRNIDQYQSTLPPNGAFRR